MAWENLEEEVTDLFEDLHEQRAFQFEWVLFERIQYLKRQNREADKRYYWRHRKERLSKAKQRYREDPVYREHIKALNRKRHLKSRRAKAVTDRVCKECGTKWTSKVQVGRPSNYCSERCRVSRAVRARSKGPPRECGYCRKLIELPRPRQVYCSTKCYLKQAKGRRKNHGGKEADQVRGSCEGGEDGVPTGSDEGSYKTSHSRTSIHCGCPVARPPTIDSHLDLPLSG